MNIVAELNPHVQALRGTIEMLKSELENPNITTQAKEGLFAMLEKRTEALKEIEQMENPTPENTRPLLKKIFKMM